MFQGWKTGGNTGVESSSHRFPSVRYWNILLKPRGLFLQLGAEKQNFGEILFEKPELAAIYNFAREEWCIKATHREIYFWFLINTIWYPLIQPESEVVLSMCMFEKRELPRIVSELHKKFLRSNNKNQL